MIRRSVTTIVVYILFCLITVGCSGFSTQTAAPADQKDSLLITGLTDGEYRIAVSTIRSMPEVSGEAVTIDSAGNESVIPFVGTELDSILQKVDVNRSDLSGLRIIAGDGYAVHLPATMIQDRQVILAWNIDNHELKGNELRSVIPEERSMYWVKGVCELELLFDQPPGELSQLVILDNMLSSLPTITADIDGETVPAVAIADIPGLSDQHMVTFIAVDGLAKREDIQAYPFRLALSNGLILTAPDLPLGMRIRNVAAIVTGDKVFVYLAAFGHDVPGNKVLALIADYLESPQVTVDLGEAGGRELDLTITTFTRTADIYIPAM